MKAVGRRLASRASSNLDHVGATLTAPYSTSLPPCPPGLPGDVNVQHIIIYCHGGQRDV